MGREAANYMMAHARGGAARAASVCQCEEAEKRKRESPAERGRQQEGRARVRRRRGREQQAKNTRRGRDRASRSCFCVLLALLSLVGADAQASLLLSATSVPGASPASVRCERRRRDGDTSGGWSRCVYRFSFSLFFLSPPYKGCSQRGSIAHETASPRGVCGWPTAEAALSQEQRIPVCLSEPYHAHVRHLHSTRSVGQERNCHQAL